MINSPWTETDKSLLKLADSLLPFTGEDIEFWIEGQFLAFHKYKSGWSIIAEGHGTPRCKEFISGSCMERHRVESLLRRLIDARIPKQMDLFA